MQDILKKVKEVAREAGTEIMKYYGEDNEVSRKKDKSLVTEVDFLSEKIILKGLEGFGYGVLSEEALGSEGRRDEKRVWVVDPIDGTMDFINETGEFSVMIGLVEDGEPILGVVYQPPNDKMYYAYKNGGAYLEQRGETRKLHSSDNNDFSRASMIGSRHHMLEMEVKLARKLGIEDFITHGSAGLKICQIAEQNGDIYINSSNKTAEWDICAGEIILTEAGGRLTDLSGQDFKYNKKKYLNLDGFIASNGILHDKIVEGVERLKDSKIQRFKDSKI